MLIPFKIASLLSLTACNTSSMFSFCFTLSGTSICLIVEICLAIMLHLSLWKSIVTALPFSFYLYPFLWLWVPSPEIITGYRAFPFLFHDFHFDSYFFVCWCICVLIYAIICQIIHSSSTIVIQR